MPHVSAKTSHENLKKQTETVLSLLTVLRSMDKNTGPPLFTLLCEKNINLSSVLETLIKSSDNETLRHRICELGVLQVIADLLKHPIKRNDNDSLEMRYHACTLLTNLSVGNTENKRLMISIEGLITGLLDQLTCSNEELQRISASVLRNLSLNADEMSKKVLRDSGIIPSLMTSAMKAREGSTLECLLNALWNVSGHSEENKKDICEFPGSLKFIVSLLVRENPSIIENGGGILKNISSYITVQENMRQILRQNNCYKVLLKHLQSKNMKIVSNACGTLWNLSARCAEDQCALLELGAVAMLGRLVTSEHEAISIASSAALKNLVTFKMNNSTSINFNTEFERHENKRLSSPACSKTLQNLNNRHQKVCNYEESMDEMIDFSRRYEEFHEQSHTWKNKPNMEDISGYSQFSRDHVVPKRNALHQNFSMMLSAANVVDMPVRSNGISVEVPVVSNHLHKVFQDCKQDFVPLSSSDHPKHYCTEDTPDCVYRGSAKNVAKFNSVDIRHYQDNCASQTIATNNGLNPTRSIYKELESSSPKEAPVKYCMEDTPEGFSRGSSLSSLSMKSLETFDNKKVYVDKVVEQSFGLPRINENETLSITPLSSKNKYKLCPQEASCGTKAVTFDETPLMFSRSSSLASLNSFDVHSLHSSLVSEYSRRASSVVSPSELPNSPGDSPPTSQLRQSVENGHLYDGEKVKSNIDVDQQVEFKDTKESDPKCSISDNEDENAEELLCQVMQAAMPKDEKNCKVNKKNVNRNNVTLNVKHLVCPKKLFSQKPCFVSVDVTNEPFNDTMKTYAVEGTPLELSRSASLSILTADDAIVKKGGDKSDLFVQFMKYNQKKVGIGSCEDSLHVYCTEQTPSTFSRNESLSPLYSKDSPHKFIDISHDLHYQVGPPKENSKKYFQPIIATSTPSNKSLPPPGKHIASDGKPDILESPGRIKNEIKSLNLPTKYDDVSSSSSSFSCSSDDSNDAIPSVDHCIEIAMPKCKERKKKNFFVFERKSCEGSSLNQSKDLYQSRRISKLDKSFSDDGDTEANNTIIYKGSQDVLRNKETIRSKETYEETNDDITNIIGDFYEKTSFERMNGGCLLHHPRGQGQGAKTCDNNLSSTPINEKKNNKITNFFKRYSNRKKNQNVRKLSPSKDDGHKKFGLSTFKKSKQVQTQKDHQKYNK